MNKLMSMLLAMTFALTVVACGDPGEFDDVPDDQQMQQPQDDGMGGGGDDW